MSSSEVPVWWSWGMWGGGCEGYVRAVQSCFFFFQAEDGIRDLTVTGVQTCALPISCQAGQFRGERHLGGLRPRAGVEVQLLAHHAAAVDDEGDVAVPEHRAAGKGLKIGRASCRERV